MTAFDVELIGSLLSSCVECEVVVDGEAVVDHDAICSGVGVELSVTVGDFRSVVVEGVIRSHDLDVGEGEVTCDPAVECILWSLLVFDFDSFGDIGQEAVGEVTTGSVAEEEALVPTDTNNGPSVDSWG